MPTDSISYQNSGYFSPLINDYLNHQSNLQSLYNHFPTIENFEKQLIEKQQNYNSNIREILVSVLNKQYELLTVSELTKKNIALLLDKNTFTITTGHQLNLFTGPIYFIYKIISTINLTKELKSKYPNYNFVPIYWMTTEDHDFEEINYFNFKGKKFQWNRETSGPVGRLSTEGLDEFLTVFEKELGSGTNADAIKNLFKDAYANNDSLANATRYLANELFRDYGLVILDADNSELKTEFIPYIKEELVHQTSNKKVLETIAKLKEYAIQVNPREINLFYIEDNLRERILFEDGKYKINNTKIEFSENGILELVDKNPEKFSPNVILRPLYQEVILPNLCYIGGGGEIAYWLELKATFEAFNCTFPILLLRNSALLVTPKQAVKVAKLGLTWIDLFSKQEELINRKVVEISEIPVDFSIQKDFLKQQFSELYAIANQTDKSFLGAVKAQEAKQIKGLDNLEKRLLKAQKKKYVSELERIIDLQNDLFPNQSLQERKANFSEFYLESGKTLIEKLVRGLNPLEFNFTILTL
ncbi:MAG: bacillithiol biosynthesis cysteine-adding enzyme BshC [Flavobacteriaceae bacterium]|nr:bacillithiol biosynthesis cysteine-adding enzyme BshC [Flavobacteriaceae bacterium]